MMKTDKSLDKIYKQIENPIQLQATETATPLLFHSLSNYQLTETPLKYSI